jgi:hypothetical protein
MSEPKKSRKRIVAKPERVKIKDPVRTTANIERRTAGILAHYAKTRGMTESMVVERALSLFFQGWRITDPDAAAGEEEAAA